MRRENQRLDCLPARKSAGPRKKPGTGASLTSLGKPDDIGVTIGVAQINSPAVSSLDAKRIGQPSAA